MGDKNLPTQDTEAFASFVQGRVLLNSYLETGHGERLQQARDLFRAAAERDSNFDIATLYLAVAEIELRESKKAIETLEKLVLKNRYLPEACVQMAYAGIKLYRDYNKTEKDLGEAAEVAKKAGRKDLIDLIQAYRVFLLAVRGGRGDDEDTKREEYLNRAVQEGEQLLAAVAHEKKPTDEKTAIQFEANNAIGIAYMWLGHRFPSKPDAGEEWEKAEAYFLTAKALRPNSVRVMQNLGSLRMMQGDRLYQQDHRGAYRCYEEAKQLVSHSMELNKFDQFPHFQMALLSARTLNWSAAQDFVDLGKPQKGAVQKETWDELEKAIKEENWDSLLKMR